MIQKSLCIHAVGGARDVCVCVCLTSKNYSYRCTGTFESPCITTVQSPWVSQWCLSGRRMLELTWNFTGKSNPPTQRQSSQWLPSWPVSQPRHDSSVFVLCLFDPQVQFPGVIISSWWAAGGKLQKQQFPAVYSGYFLFHSSLVDIILELR